MARITFEEEAKIKALDAAADITAKVGNPKDDCKALLENADVIYKWLTTPK